MRVSTPNRSGWALVCLVLLAAAAPAVAADEEPTPWDHLQWRNVGPVNMSGRVTDVEGVPGNPNVVWVGAASGGVWKTTDGGLTFAPVFDDQPIASVGDLALAPSNPDVVYVGTGESNVRNSVSFGNGVYRSPDGGATWRRVGLEKTRHVSRVLVHPSDPDTVWVGALGSIYGPAAERGVFRSTDGGQSWQKTLYLDEWHGVADIDLDPTNPNVLYAALWRFERKPWTHRSGSEEGGVWKSVDGGATWTELEEGLPKLAGRLGVKVAPSDPQVVYVIAESDEGTLFRSADRGKKFEKVSEDVEIVSRGFYYTDLRVDPVDEDRVYAVASRLFVSPDGGKTFTRISRSTHIDFHSLWIDPLDPDRMWQGQDGGVAVSYDRGRTWEPIRNLPIGQFYQAFHDDRRPFYFVGGGLQDNGTWYGPSRTREPAGILPDDWRMMSFGDAYWVVPHPQIEDLFLSESQAGGIVRTDMRTRQQLDVSPQPRRNDGGPVGELEYRFNWNSPIVASPHDPLTVYFAGNVVFKSTDFGDTWQVISPDLTTDDPAKQGEAGGPAWTENTTAEYHCTLISFAESPARAGVLWAGSDDGLVQVSTDGGASWTDVTRNLRGLPPHSPVSHLEPARGEPGTAWAAFDRHMLDDFGPHLYRTTDYGASWRRLPARGLPDEGWIWALRQDPSAAGLLWAGTEVGLYLSRDGGESFERMHLENLPAVAVHDVLIHPRQNDLILGTHGRAIWIFDDATPLQQFGPEIAERAAHLFPVRTALRFPQRFTRYGLGDKSHRAPNPPDGAPITYYLKEELEEAEADGKEGDRSATDEKKAAKENDQAEERLQIAILDGEGAVIRTLDGDELGKKAGLNRVAWDLARDPPRARKDEKPERGEFGGPPRGPMVLPGSYTVRLTLDGESLTQPVEVAVDPTVGADPEALAAQFEVASRLTALRSAVNDALRGLDALAAQVAARREAAKLLRRELPAELETALDEHAEAAREILGRLARAEDKPRWSQGPRLIERLDGLFSDVDGQFAAPTGAQTAYFAELETEAGERLGEVDLLFGEGVAALNAVLEAHGVPPVMAPGPVASGAGGPAAAP